MYRTALLLAALAATSAHGATIFSHTPPNRYASLEDPGPGWVRFRVGGNLDVSLPELAVIVSSYKNDEVWLDQLGDGARHEFFLFSGKLDLLQFRSPDRPTSFERLWAGQDPADFTNVETIELVGGAVTEIEPGVWRHAWTKTIDGGAPQQLSVPIEFRDVPELSTLLLACLALLGLKRLDVLQGQRA